MWHAAIYPLSDVPAEIVSIQSEPKAQITLVLDVDDHNLLIVWKINP